MDMKVERESQLQFKCLRC